MRRNTLVGVVTLGAVAVVLLVTGGRLPAAGIPYVQAESPIEAGRYLIVAGGCNDCHTPEWDPTHGKAAPSQWLKGNSVGIMEQEGTAYSANLRLAAAEMTEAEWVAMFRHPKPEVSHKPMPWQNVRNLNGRDIRAIYQFIRSLGTAGEKAPKFVPAGEEPKTAYMKITVVPAKGQ